MNFTSQHKIALLKFSEYLNASEVHNDSGYIVWLFVLSKRYQWNPTTVIVLSSFKLTTCVTAGYSQVVSYYKMWACTLFLPKISLNLKKIHIHIKLRDFRTCLEHYFLSTNCSTQICFKVWNFWGLFPCSTDATQWCQQRVIRQTTKTDRFDVTRQQEYKHSSA